MYKNNQTFFWISNLLFIISGAKDLNKLFYTQNQSSRQRRHEYNDEKPRICL